MRHLTANLLNINQAQLTIDILEKLACLSHENWAVQMIVVDNGSRPDQLQMLLDWFNINRLRFSEMLLINASYNLGADGGRNLAFKLASADKILIMDNDLVLPDDSEWLNKLWQHLENNSDVGIAGPMLVFAKHPEIINATGVGLTDDGRVGYLNRADPIDCVLPTQVELAASPSACWLLRKEAQQSIGLISGEFYPMQYEDIDFCLRLGVAGWKIICDRSIKIKHIENVTTRNLEEHPYTRVSVKHWIKFREKWADTLPRIATITKEDIYWGPIPRLAVQSE